MSTIVAVIVIILTNLYWPTAWGFAAGQTWCIIMPHRVRVGCAQGLIDPAGARSRSFCGQFIRRSVSESYC